MVVPRLIVDHLCSEKRIAAFTQCNCDGEGECKTLKSLLLLLPFICTLEGGGSFELLCLPPLNCLLKFCYLPISNVLPNSVEEFPNPCSFLAAMFTLCKKQ